MKVTTMTKTILVLSVTCQEVLWQLVKLIQLSLGLGRNHINLFVAGTASLRQHPKP